MSTTVDADLLDEARTVAGAPNDAGLLDEALRALLRSRRRAEIDAAYAEAYYKHPFDEPDAWGDLASFADAASRS